MESKENYFLLSSKLERIYIPLKNNEYEIGDIVTVNGKKEDLDFEMIESSFDFKDYLNKKGVYYQIKNFEIDNIFSTPIRLRSLKKAFLSNFDEQTASLINSILFGENDYSSLNKDISSLSLGRLLSVSGIYIYAFLAFLNFVLSFLMKEKYSKLVSFVLLCFYLVFTFPKFSVIKISLLFLMRWINDYLLNKKFSNLTLLGSLGFFFLIIDYHYAYQTSYLLGFIIPFFIYILNNSFSFKKEIYKKIFTILMVFLFFIPMQISFSNELNVFGPIYQIIFTPILIIYAFMSMLCFIKIPLYSGMNSFTSGLDNIFSFLSQGKIAVYAPNGGDIFIIIYMIFFLLVLYYSSIKFKLFKHIAIISFSSLLFFYFIPFGNLISEEVSFINVGQGDSCLIRKGTTTILIDTGGNKYKDIATECLIPYLKSKRIYNIDLVITTHDDYDHSGALSSLIENFYVKEYVSSLSNFPLTKNGITFKNYNIYESSWKEENDRSLVIGFNLCGNNFLITGDAPKTIENLIMKDNLSIPCDVLKVAHHGSNTSTSEKFIKYLKPKEAIISVGKNYYGHPHKSVLSILKSNNISYRRTDIDGTIMYQKYLIF